MGEVSTALSYQLADILVSRDDIDANPCCWLWQRATDV